MRSIGVPDPAVMDPPGLVWVLVGIGLLFLVAWAVRKWEDSGRD